ncbi:RluA family pseudouridine synthase [Bacillus tianshenii]|nr:RluA family pseudouridine synthase [Bacillus tianshenii]
MSNTFIWTVEEEHEGMMLRAFLLGEKKLSRRLLADVKFHGGGIFVNEKKVTVRYLLQKDDEIKVVLPPEERGARLVPKALPLSIVYEDQYVLVVNKSPGIPVVPSHEHPDHTIANAVLYHYELTGHENTIHIVNRLDRDTSGLMLIAKDRFTHHLMGLQQYDKSIERRYLAIAEGNIREDSGVIDSPIARKEGSIIERTVHPDGQRAVTHFKVIERYGDYTLIELVLETGRTHQIRVHCASIGHTLIGDDLYGGSCRKMKRQALHSYYLSFTHPFTNEKLELQVPLPADMKPLISRPQS